MESFPDELQFMRREDVIRVTGLSAPRIYALAAKGQFPKPVKVSSRAAGWVKAEVAEWAQQRKEEREANAESATTYARELAAKSHAA